MKSSFVFVKISNKSGDAGEFYFQMVKLSGVYIPYWVNHLSQRELNISPHNNIDLTQCVDEPDSHLMQIIICQIFLWWEKNGRLWNKSNGYLRNDNNVIIIQSRFKRDHFRLLALITRKSASLRMLFILQLTCSVSSTDQLKYTPPGQIK